MKTAEKIHNSIEQSMEKITDYLERILTARVYDVAIESPLDVAANLSARLNNTLLLQREDLQTYLIDIDTESFHFLNEKYPQLGDRLINGDFLKLDFFLYHFDNNNLLLDT